MKPKIIAGISAGVLFLIFLLQNTQAVSIQFFFWKLSISRIILLLLAIFIGFIIGLFAGKSLGRNEE